jgi:uncharacterized delta-60 repeat protein
MPRFGDFDTNFGPAGSNGLVITDFGRHDIARSVAINQTTGNIIVSGYTNLNNLNDFALAGYLSNGSLDASFGLNGKVITTLGGADVARSVAIDPSNGKIIVAGYTNSPPDFALVRYLSNGSLDASFGLNGKVITNFGANDAAYSVAINKNTGKIIASGFTDASGSVNFALAGYLSNGSLDASFGLNGKVITDFGRNVNDEVNSVAIDPSNGKIIVAGYTIVNGSLDFALACYTPEGILDASFGSLGNGLVITDFGGNSLDVARSVAINPNGKIIVAGYTSSSSNDFALACYTSGGILDASFGSLGNGKVITNFGATDEGNSVAINPYGKIIVAGYTNVNSTRDFALACYTPEGILDTSFGPLDSNGLVITNFGGSDIASSLAINQTNGKIIVAGSTGVTGSNNFALASYFGETKELPISNVCFPANTLISTNQGNIAIQDLDPKIHTIRNKKIELITKTVTQDKYLVCFEKDSLGINLPSEKIIITKNHGIFYKGKMMQSKEFIGKFENVKKIKYTGEILYNVLMEDHYKMMVNNLICETLHPKNGIAKLYKILQNANPKEQQDLIEKCNEYAIKNKVFSSKR